MNNIKFSNVWNQRVSFPPKPAIRDIPKWYKETAGETPKNFLSLDRSEIPTVKKCVPFLDSISLGYIIYSAGDLVITQKENSPYYEWHSEMDLIEFHPKEQIEKYPNLNTESVPKWMNPWGIETPKGYSCLVIHPLHRDDLPFTTLSGVVDTDSYHGAINFPFTLNDNKFEGYIPAGTPIAQVFPFKRESWKMQFGNDESARTSLIHAWLVAKGKRLKLNYKSNFWKRKNFE